MKPRRAPLGHPDRAEAAILGTTGHGLDRAHEIFVRIEQVPAGFDHLLTGNPAAIVDALQTAVQFILNNAAPDQIAAALDHRVSPHLQWFVGENSRMNPAHNDGGAAFLGLAHDAIAGPADARMNADAHNIARLDLFRFEWRDGLIDDEGIAYQFGWRSAGDDIQPAGRNHTVTNGGVRGINQNDFAHSTVPFDGFNSHALNSEALYA